MLVSSAGWPVRPRTVKDDGCYNTAKYKLQLQHASVKRGMRHVRVHTLRLENSNYTLFARKIPAQVAEVGCQTGPLEVSFFVFVAATTGHLSIP